MTKCCRKRGLLAGAGVVVSLLAPAAAESQTRRAVVVGINTYVSPNADPKLVATRGWTNLNGPVNDAHAMAALLVDRFGFTSDDVHVLVNGEATRERILAAVQTYLVKPAGAKTGDQAFFFFAGHGSQVRNSMSEEPDRLDESIVPADSLSGAEDIRDKELRVLFNGIIDNGAHLTAIFDSCHSGSIARGNLLGRPRSIRPDTRDVADAKRYPPPPARRGALVISAALDSQLAWETYEDGQDHGTFSLAMFQILRTADESDPADELFARIRARMQGSGAIQEPVLDAEVNRSRGTLFGGDAAQSPRGLSVAAISVDAARRAVVLQTGRALGLAAGSELMRIDRDGKNALPRLRIATVTALSRSDAEIVEGDAGDVHSGDRFRLVTLVAPEEAVLRVWIPSSDLPAADLEAASAELRTVRASPAITWVADPTQQIAANWLSRTGGAWVLTTPSGDVSLGPQLRASNVLRVMEGSAQKTLFAALPPPASLTAGLDIGDRRTQTAIAITDSPAHAHYVLAGRIDDRRPGVVEYAWTARDAIADQWRSAMPIRSGWVSLAVGAASDSAAATLRDFVIQLGWTRAWLTFLPPASQDVFPYRLELRGTTGALGEKDTLVGSRTYQIGLTAAKAGLAQPFLRRYVYVFILDRDANSYLLYPSPGQDSAFLPSPLPSGDYPAAIPLGGVTIAEPYGLDTYVLLTSEEAIPLAHELFNRTGVVRTASIRAGGPALQQFLFRVGVGTRGGESAVPVNWSIERRTFRSVPQNQR